MLELSSKSQRDHNMQQVSHGDVFREEEGIRKLPLGGGGEEGVERGGP